MPRFVDTNIFLYAVSTDANEAQKARAARLLLRAPDLAVSTQVLGEFYVQATRPSRYGALSHEQAVRMIASMTRFPIQALTFGVVQSALATAHRHRISYWDATIIEAARASGCPEVLSEDLSGGQDYHGVLVTNPFG